MKIEKLRELTEAELNSEITKLKKELFNLRFQYTTGQLENPIKLRKKPSTGQWFLNDIQCLADIRVPVEEDPWA